MGTKVVLARLPIPYEFWRRAGMFRHGAMLSAQYSTEVFDRHFRRVSAVLPPRFTLLELGPGDSLATAVIAASYGAAKIYLVDAGAFARSPHVAPYNELARFLAQRGRSAPGAPYTSVRAMLEATGAAYLTNGLSSLHSLPGESVDFVFSQAVLEHVGRDEFDATLRALHRLQKPGSLCSHRVDLQDHLAHSLNSLRFSRRTWEGPLLSKSGFYTNRLRASQILESFSAAGYSVEAYEPNFWPELPVPKRSLDEEFAVLTEDDLRVRGFDVVASRQ